MLLNIEVLNGSFSPTFDKYVNTYSVDIAKDVDSLVLNYEIEDNCNVTVLNNTNLGEGLNYVYLEVNDGKNVNTYTLEVYKELTKGVINYEEYLKPLEVEAPIPDYILPLIVISCTFVILITYLLLFKKKKRK